FANAPSSRVQTAVANKTQQYSALRNPLQQRRGHQVVSPLGFRRHLIIVLRLSLFVRPVRLTPQVTAVVKKNRTVGLHTVADKVVNHER
ncbi:MAG: hypothetical protein OXF59_18880, partial [Pseudomonas sp.]|nr:hypothetical protein [Pseudomonas sp.]